jgi:YD repeat-containing protein
MKRMIVVAVFALLLPAKEYGQQQHPNDAPGFSPGGVYDIHDLDTINAFNGNLNVRIPLGPQFKVNALIGYQFALVYNTHLWRYDEIDLPEPHYEASEAGAFNAGLGWSLGFGNLIENKRGSGLPTLWTYASADGSQHEFTPGDVNVTTSDGSYLRLHKISDVECHVDFSDGTTQVFWRLLAGAGDWPQSSVPNGQWRLHAIVSNLSNTVQFKYKTSQANDDPYYTEIWTVSDGDRSSTVYFGPLLQRIEMPAFNGGTATYSFSYTPSTFPDPGYPAVRTLSANLLTSVSLPTVNGHNAGYSMIEGSSPTYAQGLLQKLILPTKGALGWLLGPRNFPGETYASANRSAMNPAILRPVAVTERYTYAPGSTTPNATWRYGYLFGEGNQCFDRCQSNPLSCGNVRQLTTWVLPPRTTSDNVQDPQYATVNYFSAYDPDIDMCGLPAGDWRGADYALPFTRYATRARTAGDGDPVAIRYLSSQRVQALDPANLVWDAIGSIASASSGRPTIVQSDYATYFDRATREQEARLTSTATVSDPDVGCGPQHDQLCFFASNFFNFDNYGHYRQTSTVSNYPGDDEYRTTWTNYPTTLDSDGNWILGRFDRQCTRRDSSPQNAIDVGAGGNPCTAFTLSTRYDYLTGTSLVRGVRTLAQAGDTTGSHDVLEVHTFDSHGFSTKDQYAGGDTQSLPDAGFTPPSSSAYEVDYTPTYTANGTLTARAASYAGTNLTVMHESYDSNTGLVQSSADPSGALTMFTYDERNRLHTVTPPGLAATTYTYVDPTLVGTSFSPATVSAARSGTGGSISQSYDYDGFGRLAHERRLMFDGSTVTRETQYTVTGLKTAVSGFEVAPSNFTVFSRFDVFGRPTRIKAPDGTYVDFEYISMRQLKRHVFMNTPPTEEITTETYDGMHRLREVSEADGTTTTYGYDVGGHLATVATGAQTRGFTYDNRGFLHSESHPELGSGGNGSTTYSEYDARGHAHHKVTGSGAAAVDVKLAYDPAERLTNVWDLGGTRALKEFFFGDATTDAPANSFGKLWKAKRHNNVPGVGGDTLVTETYGYGTHGLVTSKETAVSVGGVPFQTFSQGYSYDDLGEATGLDYPTCPSCAANSGLGTLTRGFTHGSLTSVAPFASWIGYNSSGMVAEVRHQGNAVDTYQDDHAMGRPSRIDFKACPTSATITPQQSTMCINMSNSASITPVAGAIYAWTIDNGNLTSASNGTSVTFTSASQGTAVLHVSVSATGCSTLLSQASIVVTGSPTITSGQPADPTPIGPGESALLTVSASGSNLTYQWYQGTAPDVTHPAAGATAASFTSPALSVTTNFWVRVGSSCGSLDSRTATVTVLGAPTIVQAMTGASTTHVVVTWSAVAGASSYVVEFAPRIAGPFADLGPPTTSLSATHDVAPSAVPIAYVYRVRSLDAASRRSSALSPMDYAVTASALFSDEAIQKGATSVRSIHIVELRNAIDAVRLAANKPLLWQGASPPSGTISASPITTLFAGFNEARAAFQLPAFSYSPGIAMPQSGGAILSEHVQEVRNALR